MKQNKLSKILTVTLLASGLVIAGSVLAAGGSRSGSGGASGGASGAQAGSQAGHKAMNRDRLQNQLEAKQDRDRDRLKDKDRDRDRLKDQDRAQDQVYGSQLMSQKELAEHRGKMSAAKTIEKREQIRMENHKRMQERAKELGVASPQ